MLGMNQRNVVCTLILPRTKLLKQDKINNVDLTSFKQMDGSIVCLTATRPDLICSEHDKQIY